MTDDAKTNPWTGFARGWFVLMFSDELAAGQVVPMKRFGQELVLFRTEAGQAKVFDAYCPHMGAHLGHGGKVRGEAIVCPFHAWKFDGTGKCVEIPYAKRIPPKAAVACWPVRERKHRPSVGNASFFLPRILALPTPPPFSTGFRHNR